LFGNISRRGIIDIAGARRLINQCLLPMEREQAGIMNVFGRTLAEDITTDAPVPPCDTATADGYAAIASDTTGASRSTPRSLSVLSSSSPSRKRIEEGTVMRVKEGDPLPNGADTIIPPTETYRPDNGPEVMVFAEIKPGEHITPAGSSIPAGQVVIGSGTEIRANEMGLIASLGLPGVPVRRRPRVAIITTGASVIDIVEEMQVGASRNSARYALVGMILDTGCDLGQLVHVREGRQGLKKAITDCPHCDAIIIALGPQDKHNTALQALAEVGDVIFDRLQMEPASATAFAMVNDLPIFLTESRSVLEAYEAIIRPGLLALSGKENVSRIKIRASLGATLKLNPGCSHLIRAITALEDTGLVAKPLGSHSIESHPWIQPNSLIIIPENIDTAKRGENYEVILLGA